MERHITLAPHSLVSICPCLGSCATDSSHFKEEEERKRERERENERRDRKEERKEREYIKTTRWLRRQDERGRRRIGREKCVEEN